MSRFSGRVPSVSKPLIAVAAFALALAGAPTVHADPVPPDCSTITASWNLSAPIPLETAEDLSCIGFSADTQGADYVLANDIVLTNVAWDPIASFSGTLDGNGKAVRNLTVDVAAQSNAGLFSTVANAKIFNLTLDSPVITAQSLAGSLAGTVRASTLRDIVATDVHVSGAGTGNIKIGGLIGLAVNSSIADVSVTGRVESDGPSYEVGGVVGFVDGNDPGAASFRDLDAPPVDPDAPPTEPVAPVAVVTQAEFTGTVRADGSVGGIVGAADARPTNATKWIEISHATSSGTLSTVGTWANGPWEKSGIGGVVGAIFDSELSHLRSTMNVTAQGVDVGGLIGYLRDSHLRDSNALGNVTVTLTQGLDQDPSTGNWCAVGGLVGSVGVYDRGDIQLMPETLLFSNVHAQGDVSCNGGDALGGLIGYAIDLDLENASSSGDVTDGEHAHWGGTGGLIGYLYDTHLADVSASGAVRSPNDVVGGLVGGAYVSDPTANGGSQARYTRPFILDRGTFTGSVEGRRVVGGIVGEAAFDAGASTDRIHILQTASSGTVGGEKTIGGVIGHGDRTVLRDVKSTGSVTGWTTGPEPVEVGFYGGVGGLLEAGSEIQRSYSTAGVTTSVSDANTIGSFVGSMQGTMTGQSFVASGAGALQAFGDDSVTGVSDSVLPRSLQQLGQLSTYADWNVQERTIVRGWLASRTSEIWGICASVSDGLPFLQWQRDAPCAGSQPEPESDPNPTPTSNGASSASSASGATPTAASVQRGTAPQTPQDGQMLGQPTTIARPTSVPGLEMLSGIPSEALRVMRKPVGSTVASAPTIEAIAGRPVALAVRGLRPGAMINVTVRSQGKSASLGTVTVGPDGLVTIPPFRAKGMNRLTIVLADTATGGMSFVKVDVKQARGKAKTRVGGGNRSR